MQAGSFRSNLALPSLRERRENIPTLAAYFVRQMAKELDKDVPSFSDEALKVLQDHDWPGNVIELELRVHRAVVSVVKGPLAQSILR
ncbi:MAG: two-component system response regulator AtoC [Candidatus Latescibacterota bacterium]